MFATIAAGTDRGCNEGRGRHRRRRAAPSGVRTLKRRALLCILRRRRAGFDRDRCHPLQRNLRDQDRLFALYLQSHGRDDEIVGAERDRSDGRRHAARRGRPADGDARAPNSPSATGGPISATRSTRCWPASSAASASRCSRPKRRTWKSSSPSGCRLPLRRRRRDPLRAGRAGNAERGDRRHRSRRSDGAADRRRHRADADDEGRRVHAAQAGQPAQARRHERHQNDGGRTDYRRADAVVGCRTLGGCRARTRRSSRTS